MGLSGRSTRPWYSRTLHSLLVLATILAACSRAQNVGGDLVVNVRLATDRSKTTAVIPSSVGVVYVIGDQDITVERAVPDVITPECERTNCTLTLGLVESMATITFNSSQSLVLTIRDDLVDSCKEYNVPRMFSNETSGGNNDLEPYVFRCEPLENATEVMSVRWRWFRTEEEVRMFQEDRSGYDDRVISTGGNFMLSGSKDVQLSVSRTVTSKPENIVFYYVPSFMMASGPERVTAETVIFLGPVITSPMREFSHEVIFGSRDAQNFTKIECKANTFPPASASWVLTNSEFQNGTDLTDYGRFGTTIFFHNVSMNFSMVQNAVVQMLNLSYEDDGIFTCTVSNQFNSAEQSVTLRVKSPLRPLWPALGIIGVFISMGLIMLTAFSVEKVTERVKKNKHSEGSNSTSVRHSSVSSAASSSNNKGRKHSGVHRVSSAKPLIDESTI